MYTLHNTPTPAAPPSRFSQLMHTQSHNLIIGGSFLCLGLNCTSKRGTSFSVLCILMFNYYSKGFLFRDLSCGLLLVFEL
jgi:hypothetical protein